MASVKVAVRVRPFNKRELNMGSKLVAGVNGNQVILEPPPPLSSATPEQAKVSSASTASSSSLLEAALSAGDRGRPHKFTFDFAHWSHDRNDANFATQEKVFNDLGMDVVGNAFNGYNVCVFAYGQTGSGKTYTMMGNDNPQSSSSSPASLQSQDQDSHHSSESNSELGLIPRICQTMFAKMQQSTDNSTTFRTEASYLEIYNEKVKDLLGPDANGTHGLKVREHPKDGPYVQSLSKHLVMDYAEIKNLMERGSAIRTTASTNMNDTSSRSHAIFTVTFAKAGFMDGLPHETVSKIHLVDLAGSERANASGATGKRLKEGGHINKSLVTLGSVISALAEASKSQNNNSTKPVFIPYRDSVLTWLLKDSLGGNSKTIMIATISPAEVNHNETLSTLRYANRAKNIINKPTVNEDPNVKLIRELRNEIDRLRASLTTDLDSNDPNNNLAKKLAVKEAHERELTLEWTEKWKEAAKILDEHKALALKQTGLGVSLDSDKPHLVGIDEDVSSTGITLYHLLDGATNIGSEEKTNDIVLKSASGIEARHCVINLKEGIATLVPQSEDAMCMINAVTVNQPIRLYQGCVIVLGKTNMFRYNDPTEAANMRMNLSNSSRDHLKPPHFQSLLSQSMSDLRMSPNLKGHNSSTPIRKLSSVLVTSSDNNNGSDLEQELLEVSDVTAPRGLASPDSISTMTPTSSTGSNAEAGSDNSAAEMSRLYEAINAQKDVIMKCLESDTCDISGLNEQLGILQTMQQKYSKLEFQQARSLWMAGMRHLGDVEATEADYETQFSVMVEQEVERRLFQEKVLKAESEFQERELIKMEREREMAILRRQHEREIYMLKRKLHENTKIQVGGSPTATTGTGSNSDPDSMLWQDGSVSVTIPTFTLSGIGSNSHVEYQVTIKSIDAHWTVMRRFRQFRDLHMAMMSNFGQTVTVIPFPSRKIFGNRSEQVSGERQTQLMAYINVLLLTLLKIPTCPIYKNPTRDGVLQLSAFFQPDAKEATENVNNTSSNSTNDHES